MGWVKRIIGETSENRIIGRKKKHNPSGPSLNAIIVKLSNVAAMITVVIGKIIHGVVVLERSYYSRSGW